MVGPCNCMLLMFCRNTAGGLYSQMQILQGSFSQITEQANTASHKPHTRHVEIRALLSDASGGETLVFSGRFL